MFVKHLAKVCTPSVEAGTVCCLATVELSTSWGHNTQFSVTQCIRSPLVRESRSPDDILYKLFLHLTLYIGKHMPRDTQTQSLNDIILISTFQKCLLNTKIFRRSFTLSHDTLYRQISETDEISFLWTLFGQVSKLFSTPLTPCGQLESQPLCAYSGGIFKKSLGW